MRNFVLQIKNLIKWSTVSDLNRRYFYLEGRCHNQTRRTVRLKVAGCTGAAPAVSVVTGRRVCCSSYTPKIQDPVLVSR